MELAHLQWCRTHKCGNDETYGVLTFAKPIRNVHDEQNIKDGLSKLNAKAEWVRPVNLCLQQQGRCRASLPERRQLNQHVGHMWPPANQRVHTLYTNG